MMNCEIRSREGRSKADTFSISSKEDVSEKLESWGSEEGGSCEEGDCDCIVLRTSVVGKTHRR